ncbi:PEP-CTERM sorting domain-containing protein [Botrimarina sp.]|uniref:PEP-CTERM sorting domain-containing protein n=1 Tax=Botrimarina sp. TaxID=2795802 RepID=UPI0032EDDA81
MAPLFSLPAGRIFLHGAVIWAAVVAASAHAQTLFNEDYASGATTTTALVPSAIINGSAQATPVFEIEPFIVNPDTNGGSPVGAPLLTYDPQAPNPQGVPEGFQSIDFDQPRHPDDPSNYEEILAQGAWWSDNPTTFFHQNASIDLNPQLDTRQKVYVLEYSVASNIAVSSTESMQARIGLFDSQDQGVYFGHTYNTRNAGDRFRRTNQINVHRVNENGENVHIEVGGAFTTEARNLAWGQSQTVTPPALDFTDFKFRAEDQSGILSHFFQYETVVRVHDLDNGRMNVEWFSEESIPANPADDASTPFGGSPGMRPEKDGWHSMNVVENIYDLSGPEKQPLGDLGKLRISLWNPRFGNPDTGEDSAVTVSNLDEINTDGSDRSTNNHQTGFGRIVVNEYHVGDIDRDGQVTSADVTGSPLLSKLGVMGERVWRDGDTNGDKNVTVGDALAGVLTAVAGAAPSGPELQYNPANGRVQIAAGGQAISGFALMADDPVLFSGAFDNPAAGGAISTALPTELSWMNLTASGQAAGANLTGTIDLGLVAPSGLTEEQFQGLFAAAVFNTGDALSRAVSFFAPEGLPGDFNGDGTVDAADYTVWRDGLGTTYQQSDYDTWAANYGASASGAAGVPEPAAGWMLLLGSAAAGRRRWRRPS